MADNTAQNGTSNIATNDIGGVHYQRTKRSLGRAGTAADAASVHRLLSAAAANQDSTVVKASAGVLYGIVATNSNAAARYLKVYNKATGPTSADTPVLTLYLPALGGISVPMPTGVDFSAGISLRATTGAGDSDTGVVAANEIIASTLYV